MANPMPPESPDATPSPKIRRRFAKRPNRKPLTPYVRVAKWISEGKLEEGGSTGCWLWLGAVTSNGYGQIAMTPKVTGAEGGNNVHFMLHRWMYELHVGPVPDGLDLDHLCRVRHCCNPWHVEPVTRSVNLQRRLVHRIAPQTHCKRGHEFTPENTMVKPTRTGTARVCRACRRDWEKARRVSRGEAA